MVKDVKVTVFYDCKNNELIDTDSTPIIIEEYQIEGVHEVNGFIHELTGLTYCPISLGDVSIELLESNGNSLTSPKSQIFSTP